MDNVEYGRCFQDKGYEVVSRVFDESDEDRCEYRLKCALSWGAENNCSCYGTDRCAVALVGQCGLSEIRYPRQAVITSFTFFLFNRQREDWIKREPDWLVIEGTVRCGNALINVTKKKIAFDVNFDARRLIEEQICRPFREEMSSSMLVEKRQSCHHWNESTDICLEWNSCLSVTRIGDGIEDCLNGKDEVRQIEMEMEKSCAHVRRHRFRCSQDEVTCLSVMKLGDRIRNCRNRYDELWFGVGRTISSMECGEKRKNECFRLRQYLQVSNNPRNLQFRLSFRSLCDSFWNLGTREDEDLLRCKQQWICPKDHFRCQTGQCINPRWLDDGEWDCVDASDEYT